MAGVADPIDLGQMALFQGLEPAELSGINDLLHPLSLPARTSILTAEQPGDVAYVILKGTVKVHVEQADGGDVILAILGPGEVLGEMSLVDSLTRSASAVTQEPSTLLGMDRAAFWECLRAMPAISLNLTRILSRRLRLANAQIRALAALDVYGRVARQIVAFAQEYGEAAPNGDVVIPLRLTQSDLAGLIGASRVRVNQVLVAYKQRGYISDENHRLTVHDLAALAERCR